MLDLEIKPYAEFGVPSYWILDPFAESLECLVLDGGAGGEYRRDGFGTGIEPVRPGALEGSDVPLGQVWAEGT